MGVSASLNFCIKEYSVVDILETLLSTGWTLNDNGHISFSLAADDYAIQTIDWTNDNDGIKYLKSKTHISQIQTVCITWKNTNIGCTILAFNSDIICFQLNINRQTMTLGKKEITNFNWYLEKILPVFWGNSTNNYIEQIYWEQWGV